MSLKNILTGKMRTINRTGHPLFLALAAYAVLAILLYPIFKHSLCTDALSYINTAKQYAEGNFMEAIQPYWSPLVSWLLVPFLWVGFPDVLGYKLLLLLNGLLVIVFSNGLIKKLGMGQRCRYVILPLIAVISLSHAYEYTTPDLLFVTSSLALANVLISDGYISDKYSGILCGIIGALIYFSKAFGFPYFITCFILINSFLVWQKKNSNGTGQLLKHTGSGLVVFLLVSAVWIAPVSYKTGGFTISAAGMKHTAISHHKWKEKVVFFGDEKKETEKKGSAVQQNKKKGSGIILKQLNRIKHTTPQIAKYLLVFSFLSPLILIGGIYYRIKEKNKIYGEKIALLLSMALVLLFGYSLLVINRRYLILAEYLILIIGVKLLLDYVVTPNLKKPIKILSAAVFVSSFLLIPIRDFYFFNTLKNDRERIIADYDIDQLALKGKVGSLGRHDKALSFSLTNGWDYKTLIDLLPSRDEKELKAFMDIKNIDYLIVWLPKNERAELGLENVFKDMTNNEIGELAIYKVR